MWRSITIMLLLARHKRDRRQYGYTTDKEHLASTHKYLTDWNPDRFIKWAESIDESVKGVYYTSDGKQNTS